MPEERNTAERKGNFVAEKTVPMQNKKQRVQPLRERVNVNKMVSPSPQELAEHGIERNGVALQLSAGPPPDNIALVADLHVQFPGYLVLVQAGEFLHAYNHCAYFLHRLKNYRMQLMGSGAKAYLRVGFPLANSKRRIWKIMTEFKVPYLVVLGSKAGGYKTYASQKDQEQLSLLLNIDRQIVARTIEELRQTDQLNHASSARLLLKKDVDFRLKQVGQTLYLHVIKDVAGYPRNHRHGLGADLHAAASSILKLVFDYALSADRIALLGVLGGTVDRLKFLIMQAFELKLLRADAFNHRVALVVELGKITGGLLTKLRATASSQAVAYA